MKILVTGANGFLGRAVVAALRRAGHKVRAVVRRRAGAGASGWDQEVELFEADLRTAANLREAFGGMEVLVHLATPTSGDPRTQLADTIAGTQRLFAAMADSPVKRLVHCSSFAVYDWLKAGKVVDEDLPLAHNRDDIGGYGMAKLWQEETARRMAQAHGWQLTILRPGFIWGTNREYPPCLGRCIGPLHLVIGPRREPPLIHVDNCADAFRAAVENPPASGEAINLFDGCALSAGRYAREYCRRRGGGPRVWVPWRLAWLADRLLYRAWQCGPRFVVRMPNFLTPIRFDVLYKPLGFSTLKQRTVLNWRPPFGLQQCLERTFSPNTDFAAAIVGGAE
jgi:2-alkyl-3-oxoalkanoate reductase